MVLIIDNYDSFVYNILHYMNKPSENFLVLRNDDFTIDSLKAYDIKAIVISPGPMSPNEAGLSNSIIKCFYNRVPILGICLGHQCIGSVFGCTVEQYYDIKHGEASKINLRNSIIYEGLSSEIVAARYHSLYIASASFNDADLKVNAFLDDGTIMGIEHRKYPVFGVQFHPESILTGVNGARILNNFLNLSKHFYDIKLGTQVND